MPASAAIQRGLDLRRGPVSTHASLHDDAVLTTFQGGALVIAAVGMLGLWKPPVANHRRSRPHPEEWSDHPGCRVVQQNDECASWRGRRLCEVPEGQPGRPEPAQDPDEREAARQDDHDRDAVGRAEHAAGCQGHCAGDQPGNRPLMLQRHGVPKHMSDGNVCGLGIEG